MTNYSAFYTNKDRKYRGGLCRIFTDVDCYINYVWGGGKEKGADAPLIKSL